MKNQVNLDEFIPKMDTPEKVCQLFNSLGYKVLDAKLKTKPSIYNLPAKDANFVEKIFAVANYDRRFQILLFKLKEDSKEAIRNIPEKILREVDYPFIIFTPDFKTFTFTLVEKVREGPGEFKRKLTKLIVDRDNPYHTDKEILSNIALDDDIKSPAEIYKVFQKAFSVEKVTKKFFTEYYEVFKKLSREVAKQNKHLKFTLFARDGSVDNFAKVLLGRLTFLYFIQKRGWLNCFDGWGSGDKRFLFNKFQEAKGEKKNYFKDYLEPLFFETLNNPRRDKPDQATIFGGRIPFLNGGLFEPEYDYQDPRNHVFLDNNVFEFIFSVFEKYNFTVKEDEPLDKEVAIDPEMLGKVFENLLEENLRKGKGTYYTPREIVHYMCRESLINYLTSETGIAIEEIRSFLGREKSLDKKKSLSFTIKKHAREIDRQLEEIRVLDPACGSGAFLVGMLHEIVNARISLNRELGRNLSEYQLKKETIQNNVYGVDIDPGAAEIAKLRLWLTLVVDHNLSEIEPLPNLDYKIMVGNSLLDEFMGVKLFNPKKAQRKTAQKRMKNLFEEDSQLSLIEETSEKSTVLKNLQKLHRIYFKEPDPKKKKEIRSQIDKIEFDLIEATVKEEVNKLENRKNHIASSPMLKGMGIPKEIAEQIAKISSLQAQILDTLNEIKKSNVKPFFLFQLHFSEVFERKDGFDVVIANPPYVDSETMTREDEVTRAIYSSKFQSAKGNWDLFIVFIERGLQLLKENGTISYIVPNKFIAANYSKAIRNILLEKNIKEIRDYSQVNVFKEADVYPIVFFIQNTQKKSPVTMSRMDKINAVAQSNSIDEKIFYQDVYWDRYFVDRNTLKIVMKMVKNKPLSWFCPKVYGAASVSEAYEIKKYLKEYDKKETGRNIYKKFINTGTLDPYISLWGKKKTQYIKDSFMRPVIEIEDLEKVSSNRLEQANSNKIIVGGMTKVLECFYDNGNYLAGKSTTIILESKKIDLKFLLALLNSKLLTFWYRTFYSSLTLAGGYIRIDNTQLKSVPIPETTKKGQGSILMLVEKILSITASEGETAKDTEESKIADYKRQIDSLVYKLYGLTPEEIEIVEGNAK